MCIIKNELEKGLPCVCAVCESAYNGACDKSAICKVSPKEEIKSILFLLENGTECWLKSWCKDIVCTKGK